MCRISSSSSNNDANDHQETILACPLEQHGKRVPKASMTSFLVTAGFLPVWAVTVLPLSILYQVGSAALRPLIRRDGDRATTTTQIDSGYVVSSQEAPPPRSDREYDIVVLGATGFTGYLAARHLATTYSQEQVKWAIAGRSQSKLDAVKNRLAQELGKDDEWIESIDTILVDTSIPSTLPPLVRQTRVVATTAGPYTLYGNSVVEFCSKFGTHYVDITGEVDWVKAMLCQWQTEAQATGAKMIPFCGHDSIPWDVSVAKLQEVLKKEFDDDIQSVSFWDEFRGAAPGGTFATVFNGVKGNSLKAPRGDFDPFLRLPDGTKSEYVCKADLPSLPARSDSPWDKTEESGGGGWTAPFVMAVVNAQVVRWSHALRGQGSKSMTYKEVARYPDFKTAFVNFAALAMAGSMLFNPITSHLVEKYAVPKPGEGPLMEDMENKHFLCIKGEAGGKKGNRAECVFYLHKDAGCLETSRMLIEAGLCLALEEHRLPNKHGGFMSPTAGLGDVLVERLTQTGTHIAARAVALEGSKL